MKHSIELDVTRGGKMLPQNSSFLLDFLLDASIEMAVSNFAP